MFTILTALYGFPGFFIFNHASDDQSHNSCKRKKYDYCSHSSTPPLAYFYFGKGRKLCLYFSRNTFRYFQTLIFFIWTEQQVQECDNQNECCCCSDSECSCSNECSNLIYAKSNCISQYSLIPDGEPEPFDILC